MTLIDQVAGGVYGQALGDAFCMPAMLTMADTRRHHLSTPDGFIVAPREHEVHAALRAGQVTDDTEQAMFIARRVIADGVVTQRGVAESIVAWYDAVGGDTLPFVGPSTRRAVAKIRAGADLSRTGLGGDTNGAAMRVSVVGLLFPGDVDAAITAAVDSALPTHNTPSGVGAAAAVAAAIARGMDASADLRDVIVAGIDGAQAGAERASIWLGASVARRIDFAVSLARDGAGETTDRLRAIADLVGTSLAASESIPAAFGVLALAEGDPVRAARLAFELSGDADTVGAIACAMAGALRGVGAIPASLRDQLRVSNPDHDFEAAIAGLAALAGRHRKR
jgi:ADP-ribosylglycohydrolase